ncbi:MAG: SPOR domain-containing protein [Fimbriimonadales bacterium]|nr:SPOR domain-containing protein [Fimbriimonadales bacterium]
MPLEFRSREDEGFSVRRFLKTFGAGVAVFLLFMAVGYYLIGPRITISGEGRPQLRLTSKPAEQSASTPDAVETKPMPKVEVYEKLSPDVTAGTGTLIGSREVAPFDYERYQQKRRERKPKPPAETQTPAEESPAPSDDEYFVPDETASEPTPPAETPEPAPAPTEPQPAEPAPQPPQQTETQSRQHEGLYRVQIGVYENRESANQVAQSLATSGFEASIVPFQRDGKTLYRVQVLVTRDKAKADALKSQLESRGFPAVVAKVQ